MKYTAERDFVRSLIRSAMLGRPLPETWGMTQRSARASSPDNVSLHATFVRKADRLTPDGIAYKFETSFAWENGTVRDLAFTALY